MNNSKSFHLVSSSFFVLFSFFAIWLCDRSKIVPKPNHIYRPNFCFSLLGDDLFHLASLDFWGILCISCDYTSCKLNLFRLEIALFFAQYNNVWVGMISSKQEDSWFCEKVILLLIRTLTINGTIIAKYQTIFIMWNFRFCWVT